MIYLACPYSDPDPAVQEERFHKVSRVASILMREGEFVFSPISHCHPLAHYGLPGDFEFWKKYNKAMLEMCDSLTVLMLDGWDMSTGVIGERRMAEELVIPVNFLYYPKDSDDLYYLP